MTSAETFLNFNFDLLDDTCHLLENVDWSLEPLPDCLDNELFAPNDRSADGNNHYPCPNEKNSMKAVSFDEMQLQKNTVGLVQENYSDERTSDLRQTKKNKPIRSRVDTSTLTHIAKPSQVHNSSSGCFPAKLMCMLSELQHAHIVGWMPHGCAFKVFNIPAFEKQVLPKYFKTCKEKSFRRQLCLWGFKRMNRGMDKGAYYSPHFIRGKPELTQEMVCVKVKGIGKAQPSRPSEEPNFYELTRNALSTVPISHQLYGLRPVSPSSSIGSASSSSRAVKFCPLNHQYYGYFHP